jgi:hypothetical protein
MTIRFAAARRGQNRVIADRLCASVPLRAANDNANGIGADKMLGDALRHFARHGLCAAERASLNARQAFFAGDRAGYDYWIAICRTLDRRMAAAVAAHRG